MRITLPEGRWPRITAAVVAVYALGYWIPGSPLPEKVPVGVITQGVIFGSSNALLAMGLILVHRTTRIVNFAYGALGAMAGAVTVGLFVGQHWNYWLSLLMGLLVGTAAGAAVDVLVLRRFDRSSRLVATVATLGLAQLLGAIAIGLVFGLGADGLIGTIDTPISRFDAFVRPYPVRGDHLLMLALVPIAVGGLSWFLLRTDVGRAVRAAADDGDRARLLGIPVGRLRTIVGGLAGALATATYVTNVPFTGVLPQAGVSATGILPGLTIAVVARFKSLPIALVTGIGLGIAEWTVRWNTSKESAFNVVFLLVILVALLVQKGSQSRAEAAGNAWEGASALRPLPREIRELPAVRRAGLVVSIAGAFVVGFLAWNAAPSTIVLMSFACAWAMVGLSLVLLTGWGGNVSLGQFAIVGVGAMTAGNLLVRWNVDVFVALVAAAVVGGLVSAIIGVPALRIPGFGLAVATIGFAVTLDAYFLNPVNFPSFVPSQIVRPVLWKRFDLAEQRNVLWLALAGLAVAVAVVRAVRRTRIGRVVIATRDNPRFAGALAVPTTAVRLQAFVLAGAIAGLAGGIYILALGGAGQRTFPPEASIEVFSYTAIGGLGSPAGALLGILGFRGLDFVLAANLNSQAAEAIRLSLSGAGLLFVLYLLPGGLWQAVQRLRDAVVRRLVPEAYAIGGDDEGVSGRTDDAPEDEVGAISAALADEEVGVR